MINANAERVNILGVDVHALDMPKTVNALIQTVEEKRKGYVCFAGVHGIMEAQRDPALKSIYRDALIVAPDGMPTVWLGRHKGFSQMRRVFGPELMIDFMGRPECRRYRHFFCGGEPGTAECLRERMLKRFPWINIVGLYSPPFREMTQCEEREMTALVNSTRPDIIWVGLSTPKQEKFMARYLAAFDTKLMLGVGAAFLFHTGKIKDSPEWMKLAGLQWLHRLWQEPSRLWRRYLLNNSMFIFKIILRQFSSNDNSQCSN